MTALVIEQETETEQKSGFEFIHDDPSGFVIRFGECRYSFLNWQAGEMATEFRCYRDPGMVERFEGTVSLFFLKGYGHTRDEAVQMAQQKNGEIIAFEGAH